LRSLTSRVALPGLVLPPGRRRPGPACRTLRQEDGDCAGLLFGDTDTEFCAISPTVNTFPDGPVEAASTLKDGADRVTIPIRLSSSELDAPGEEDGRPPEGIMV